MTQVHIDAEKKICAMTFAGTGADLAADIGLIMGAVYQALKQDSPPAGGGLQAAHSGDGGKRQPGVVDRRPD